jgi:hypothetical protein
LSVFDIGEGNSIVGSTGSTTFINDQYGAGGNSSLIGGSGTGDISVGGADTGANVIIFAASTDKVTIGSALTYVDASKGSISVQGGNGTVIGALEGAGGFNTNILGGQNDIITLGSATTFVNALAGTTTITGGAGTAHVDAGLGTSVKGGAGSLVVDGGPAALGTTTITGGSGSLQVFDLGKGSTITGGSGTNFHQ